MSREELIDILASKLSFYEGTILDPEWVDASEDRKNYYRDKVRADLLPAMSKFVADWLANYWPSRDGYSEEAMDMAASWREEME